MKKTTFLENGQFYKGNIHCHTTCSDGKLSPDAIVKAYQDKGYDFLAITDHNVFSHYTCYDTDRFVMIQGVEGNLRAPADNHREYHFIVTGKRQRGRSLATGSVWRSPCSRTRPAYRPTLMTSIAGAIW